MNKYIPSCAVCAHTERNTIDSKLLSMKYTQKVLAAEYEISEQSISNHKNKHLLDSSMNNEKLQLLVQKALSKDLEPDNIGELVRLLDYNDKLTANSCAVCPYRNKASGKTLDEAIKDYLGMGSYDDPTMDDIFITPSEYADFKEWQKTLCVNTKIF